MFAYCSAISPNIDVTGIFLNQNEKELLTVMKEGWQFFSSSYDTKKLKKMKKTDIMSKGLRLVQNLVPFDREIFETYYSVRKFNAFLNAKFRLSRTRVRSFLEEKER